MELVIDATQIRAARALLGIDQKELAALSGCGIATIRRIEGADGPAGTSKTITRIRRALEAAGVVFIEQDEKQGPGVRLGKPLP
jgi:transcriptional regulator with XRE-family HTH domain